MFDYVVADELQSGEFSEETDNRENASRRARFAADWLKHSSNNSFQPGVNAQEVAVRFQNSIDRAALRQSVACRAREIFLKSAFAPQRQRWTLFSIVFFSLSLCLASGSRAASFDPSLYHSYSATEIWAYTLADKYPDLVKVVQYGESAAYHNPLLAIEITSNVKVSDPSKPEFLFTAGIHAREVIGSEAAISIANDLVSGYTSTNATTKSTYMDMLSKRDVWIIPQQNPDGRLQVEAGSSSQRKNWDWYKDLGQPATGAQRGVDLNRNFPHLWNLASSSVLDETYRGPSVLSEAESNALWGLVNDKSKFSNLLCSVDIHSGAATILTPWGSPSDYAQNESQISVAVQQKFTSLANTLSQKTGLSTSRLNYDYYGTESDSLYETFLSYSMTEEIYAGSGDIYSVFNPTTAALRDATTKKAVDSALYLLSDAAFTVPEPSSVLLLAAAGVMMLAFVRRRS
jgi:hypothetical protein